MKILLADDNPEVRSALRLRLEQEATMTGITVLEASNTESLIEHLIGDCPIIILLDWELSGRNGVDHLMMLRSHCPEMRVIALSSKYEARQEALAAGVDAFISKAEPPERILFTLSQLIPQNEDWRFDPESK
jgi:DNA-binding NarL/FixJ family response regulator